MSFGKGLILAFKALRELGPSQVILYTRYRLGLKSGYYRRRTRPGNPQKNIPPASFRLHFQLDLPAKEDLLGLLGKDGLDILLAEADEIAAGKIRLFGGDPVPLALIYPGDLRHWTEYDDSELNQTDIKYTWEPGRFGWAFTLSRAYYLTGDERYTKTFWNYLETFLDGNPTNLGPHWISAQEVSLRIMALVFAAQIFANSPLSTPDRLARIGWAIADHADRIPPTLVYARAQHNNHLLSEAAGLFTAGLTLPAHPKARNWRMIGWKWLNHGLRNQISRDGTYIQHSANYHRLMLQIALWVGAFHAQDFPPATQKRLGVATRWLLAILDPESGQVPNLGPNDSAYLLPLTVCPFDDYRTVLQAATSTFLGTPAFDHGVWDEMAIWLRVGGSRENHRLPKPEPRDDIPVSGDGPIIIKNSGHRSWAYFRVARFTNRPGHADQLHLDLWWRGLNIARDAGTYLYNAAPPWDNSLASTAVHNTITINGKDQMLRAGRFLWLIWAQGKIVGYDKAKDSSWERYIAQQDGYRRLGILHQRSVVAHRDGRWIVEDRLSHTKQHDNKNQPSDSSTRPQIRLHWLLPDWAWDMNDSHKNKVEIKIQSPYGWISLNTSLDIDPGSSALQSQIVRSGELIHGSGSFSPSWGWFSPTYGIKRPALSFSIQVRTEPPFTITSEWLFPPGS